MDKQEIQTKIEQANAERQLITEEIAKLQIQFGEAEKPKRHGDFGIGEGDDNHIHCRLVVLDDVYNEKYGKNPPGRNPENDIWFGNIFDLLKEWSKPFEKFESSTSSCDYTPLIIKIISIGKIQFSIGGFTSTMVKLDYAEEIWMALGQAIFELKRKQNK